MFLKAAELPVIELEESDLSSPACKSALTAFKANIVRATGLLVIPGFASLTAAIWGMAQARAQFEIFGRMASPEEIKDHLSEFHSKAQEYMNQMMVGTPETKQLLLAQMTDQFESFSSQSGPDYAVLLTGLLKSAVVQFWGSIEVMLGDLWESVLNEHPIGLAGLHGKESDEASLKSIPLSVLSANKYNISNKMGTILKAELKFTTLDGIKGAYFRAFRDDAIDAVFNDKSLLSLALVRNILVHKGGAIDKEFVRRGASVEILKPICAMGPGPVIFLDGEMVRDLLNPAILSGLAVIKSVDEWLAKNS